MIIKKDMQFLLNPCLQIEKFVVLCDENDLILTIKLHIIL